MREAKNREEQKCLDDSEHADWGFSVDLGRIQMKEQGKLTSCDIQEKKIRKYS